MREKKRKIYYGGNQKPLDEGRMSRVCNENSDEQTKESRQKPPKNFSLKTQVPQSCSRCK